MAGDPNVDYWFSAWLTDQALEIRDAPRQPAKFVAIPNSAAGERDVPRARFRGTILF
jgi:hypothetical protein